MHWKFTPRAQTVDADLVERQLVWHISKNRHRDSRSMRSDELLVADIFADVSTGNLRSLRYGNSSGLDATMQFKCGKAAK
jgi:hypothetical protein